MGDTNGRPVRPATLHDVPYILEMCQTFYLTSPFFDKLLFDSKKVRSTIEALIKNPDLGVVLLSLFPEGFPSGMLIGMLVEAPFSTEKIATELAWYIYPEGRASRASICLVDAFERWAKGKGARISTMMLLDELRGSSVERLYDRRGYELTEKSYMKVL